LTGNNRPVDDFEIRTERLRMRVARPNDLNQLMEVFGDPVAMRYIGPEPRAFTRDEVTERIERARTFQRDLGMSLWACERLDTGEVIGDCGLVPVERKGPEIEIGYRLARRHWSQGFATEAARAALDHAFGPLGLERVIAVTHPENLASRRVCEKIGMRRVGLTDKHYGMTLALFEKTTRPLPGRGGG